MTAVKTGRDYLAETLGPILPDGWKIIPYEDDFDTVTEPVLMFRVRSLAKLPTAPASTYRADWTLTVISPLTDPKRRDDDADDLAIDLLDALRTARIPWTTCEKALWGTRYVCYDVTIQLPTTRTPKPTTTTEPEE